MGVALEREGGRELDVAGPLVALPVVASRLGISIGRVYYHVAKGHLPAVRLGRRLMFSPRAVEQFIATGGIGLSASERARIARAPTRRGRPRSTAGEHA